MKAYAVLTPSMLAPALVSKDFLELQSSSIDANGKSFLKIC